MNIEILPFYMWLGDTIESLDLVVSTLWLFSTIGLAAFYMFKLADEDMELSKTFVIIYVIITLSAILLPTKKVVYTYIGIKVGQELNKDYNLSDTTLKTLKLVNKYLDKELENKEK